MQALTRGQRVDLRHRRSAFVGDAVHRLVLALHHPQRDVLHVLRLERARNIRTYGRDRRSPAGWRRGCCEAAPDRPGPTCWALAAAAGGWRPCRSRRAGQAGAACAGSSGGARRCRCRPRSLVASMSGKKPQMSTHAIGRLLAGRDIELVLAGLWSVFQPRRTLSPVTGPLVTPVPSLTAQSIWSRLTDWYRHSVNWSSISFSIRSARLRPSSSCAVENRRRFLGFVGLRLALAAPACCKLLQPVPAEPLCQRLLPAAPAPPWPACCFSREPRCSRLAPHSANVGTGVG